MGTSYEVVDPGVQNFEVVSHGYEVVTPGTPTRSVGDVVQGALEAAKPVGEFLQRRIAQTPAGFILAGSQALAEKGYQALGTSSEKVAEAAGDIAQLPHEAIQAAQPKDSQYALDLKSARENVAALIASIFPTDPANIALMALGIRQGTKPQVETARPAPATFIGMQDDMAGGKFPLFNLTEDIPGHPTGSTVAGATLEKAGFSLPKESLLAGERGSTVGPESTVKTMGEVAQTFKDSANDIKAAFAPAVYGQGAAEQARLMRPQIADLAQKTEIAQRSLNDARIAFEKQTPEANMGFIDAMEQPGGIATLSQDVKPIAETLKAMFEDRRIQIQALGTGKLSHFIEDYFPHIWKDPEAAATVMQGYARRPLEGSGAFLKQRTVPTTAEGLARGLEPVSTNPVDLTLTKIHEMDRFLMGQRVFAEMKEQGLAKFVKFGESAPEGWGKVNDKIAKVLQHVDEATANEKPVGGGFLLRGEYYAPEGAARVLNNYLSPGLSGRSALYDAARMVNNTLNQAQLGLSFFHGGFEILDAQKSKLSLAIQNAVEGRIVGTANALAEVPLAPGQYLYKGHQLLKEYYNPGTTTPELAQMVSWIKEAGGRFSEPWYYRNNSVQKFWSAIHEGSYGKAGLQAFPAILEQAAKPIMQWMVPRMKAGVAEDLMKFELSKLPEGTGLDVQRAIVQRAWDSVDNRLGQLVYDNLFWDRTLKDTMMLATRSVGWNFGTYREFGGGLTDLVKMAKTGELTPRTAYMIASPMVTALYGAVIMYLYTGKGPSEFKDYFYPKTGRTRMDGSEDRVSLPAYERDFYGYLHHLPSTIAHKTSPLINAITEMYQNEDFYGEKIFSSSALLEAMGKSVALERMKEVASFVISKFSPFTIQGMAKQLQTGAGVAEALIPSFVGVMPAPAEITQNPDVAKAKELERAIPEYERQIIRKAKYPGLYEQLKQRWEKR